MWRKDTGDIPRLLFAPAERSVTVDEEGNVETVTLRSTAAGVLSTLSGHGLGWDASVAAYSSVRGGGHTGAFLAGQYTATEYTDRYGDDADDRFDDTDDPLEAIDVPPTPEQLAEDRAIDAAVRSRIARESAPAAEEDLQHLGALLAAMWADPDGKVLLLDDLAWDAPVELNFELIQQTLESAEQYGLPALPIARAVETLVFLFRDARLIAWPLITCVLLKHLPTDTDVVYDLSGGIWEFEMETVEHATSFLDRWWASTGDSIATYAQSLGMMFGSLSAFRSKLGPQFWFGQAIAANAHLRELNKDRANSTKKARGDALESLAEALFNAEEQVVVTRKNFATEEEEIDLVLRNELDHAFWAAHHSPLIIVECKNWAKPVGVEPLRVLESKLEDRRGLVRIGVFISVSGFTKEFLTRLKAVQGRDIGVIYALTGADVDDLVARRQPIMEWLRTSGAMRAFGA